jgi:hypothetical protein
VARAAARTIPDTDVTPELHRWRDAAVFVAGVTLRALVAAIDTRFTGT